MDGMEIPQFNTQIFAPKPFVPKTFEPDPKTVLVIGNGFDMDLHMETSYKAYANSSFWPFNGPIYQREGSLSRFLNDKRDFERWLDIEEALAEYASIKDEKKDVDEDKKCYELLVSGLQKYLMKQQDDLSFTNSVPTAKIILDKLISNEKENKNEYHIYSFNYTNLYYIARKMMINLDQNRIQYIHGSLRNNDIILGTGDVADLPDEYFWLYKSSNQHYHSNNLVEDLADADEVIIFGHSFGRNDFDYFMDFFQTAIHERTKRFIPDGYSKIKLRIITKDKTSELDIKRQLRKLTNKHVQGLYAHCDFKILHTVDDICCLPDDEI